MVLVGMYMVLDMVFNIDDLSSLPSDAAAGGTVSMIAVVANIADYYFHHAFLFFNQLAGIIPVVAAAFTLLRLSRFNELTAVLAAGVPLLRVAAPIILAGLVLNGLVWANQELVIPNMIDKLNMDRDDMHRAESVERQVSAMQDDDGSLLYVSRYAAARLDQPASMRDVVIVYRGADGQSEGMTTAAAALWDGSRGGWKLFEGNHVSGLRPEQTPTAPEPTSFWKTSINPEEVELFRNSEFVEMLSTDRINQLLARPKSYGSEALLRVKHWRFTQPLMNFILLLLAIPCVLTREPGQLKTAATKCLLFTGAAMASVFICQQIATRPPTPAMETQWPALMAWGPIFVFAPLSVYLLDRIKT